MKQIIRAATPILIGVIALIFFLLRRGTVGDLQTEEVSIVAVILWILLLAGIGAGAAMNRLVATLIAPGFIALVGLSAGVWPLAFVIAENPIRVDMVSLRAQLPNIILLGACWAALYFYPAADNQNAAHRLFSRFSLATGRLLIVALFTSTLFYSMTVGAIEEQQQGLLASEQSVGAIDLFYGSNPIYFILVTMVFWGIGVALNLAVRIYAERGSYEAALREPFDAAFLADRRFLATLTATLPLMGFLGTILGISDSIKGLEVTLSGASYDPADLQALLRDSLGGLSLAFETTILGIGASALLLIASSYIDKGGNAPVDAAPDPATRD